MVYSDILIFQLVQEQFQISFKNKKTCLKVELQLPN